MRSQTRPSYIKGGIDIRRTVEIKLNFPVEIGNVERSTVTMRRPKGRDVKANFRAAGGEQENLEATFKLLADLCNLAPDEFDELDMSDIEQLGEQLEAFMGKTGFGLPKPAGS